MKNNNLIKAVLFSSILFIGILLLGNIIYESNDEFYMNLFANGLYSHGEFMLYPGIIFGYFLKTMYLITDKVNMFTVFLIVAVYISTIIFNYYILKKFKFKLGLTIILLLSCTFYLEVYLNLQYTKVAAFMTTASLFILLLDNKVLNKSLGSLLLILGLSLRVQAALIPIACAMLVTLPSLFSKHRTNILKIYIFVGMSFSIFFISNIMYSLNHSFHMENIAYDKERVNIQDYGVEEYIDLKESYDKIGVSPNDLSMAMYWLTGDNNYFNTIFFQDINNVQPNSIKYDVILGSFVNTIKSMLNFYRNIYVLSAVILLVFNFLFNNKYRREILLIGLFFVTMVFYFNLIGRYLWRVEYSLLVSVTMFGLLFSKDDSKINQSVLFKILTLSLVLVIGISYNFKLSRNWLVQKTQYDQNYHRYMDELANYPDEIFLVDMVSVKTADQFDVFDNPDEGYVSNSAYLGGWLINLPGYQEHLGKLGINNVYKDLTHNKKLRLLFADENRIYFIEKHLNSNYCKTSNCYDIIIDKHIYDIPVFKVVNTVDDQ